MGDIVVLILLVAGACGFIISVGYLIEKNRKYRGAITDAIYELESEGNPVAAWQHLTKAAGE